ncbi:hypothetical protein EHS25_006699 [Saitozyma podzolica]|uniref:4'-phosphopantetheinyl transferase domain-containing protein n=1 Tax=Saitozyma podzolica TaxID=1890683 RepID=A0A427YST1_9TREE|nr:hypothetical protein EHS25_006699 [Saitozyma podzolica]
MLLGIGIDILSLSRFEGVIARRGFQVVAKRICCARELDEFGALRDDPGLRIRYLSGRWAIKEAAYKSLYPHVRTTFRSFDLRKSKGSGQPKLHLIGHTTSKPEQSHGDGDSNIDVEEVDLVASLSHDAGVVVGVVIAQRRG